MKAMIRKSMLREVDRSPSKSPQKSFSPSRSGSISPTRLNLRKGKSPLLEESYMSPSPKKKNKENSPDKIGLHLKNSDTFNL